MPRKKILYLITKATWGGAQRYVYDLAINLSKDTFEPVVAYGESGKLAAMLDAKSIRTRRVPALGRDVAFISDVTSFFQILTVIRQERPDVVHLNSSKAAALGALAAQLCGIKKIIFTVHGWPFKESRNIMWKVLVYKISWLTALLSHAIIVVSKADELIGQSMLFVGKKVHYIPVGIKPPQFFSREEASSALAITATTPRVVTIAELTVNKGVRYTIEAVALLKQQKVNVDYFVLGDGEERAALETLASKTGVSDRVHFLGFILNAAQYLKAFDIFLLPSIKEGMPYVLLEAAASGLPILMTTAVVDMKIPNSRIVPTHDARALADALMEQKKTTSPTPTHDSLSMMLEKTVELY